MHCKPPGGWEWQGSWGSGRPRKAPWADLPTHQPQLGGFVSHVKMMSMFIPLCSVLKILKDVS